MSNWKSTSGSKTIVDTIHKNCRENIPEMTVYTIKAGSDYSNSAVINNQHSALQ